MSYDALPSRFLSAVDRYPSPRAQMVRRAGRWEAISSQEFLRRVAGLANCFIELGVKSGDRVGLFAPSCPEWHTADFAISGSGAVTVPVYFNESPDRMAYILHHCGAEVLFIAGRSQLEKFLRIREQLPNLQKVFFRGESKTWPAAFLPYKTLFLIPGPSESSAFRKRAAQFLPT